MLHNSRLHDVGCAARISAATRTNPHPTSPFGSDFIAFLFSHHATFLAMEHRHSRRVSGATDASTSSVTIGTTNMLTKPICAVAKDFAACNRPARSPKLDGGDAQGKGGASSARSLRRLRGHVHREFEHRALFGRVRRRWEGVERRRAGRGGGGAGRRGVFNSGVERQAVSRDYEQTKV